MITLPQGYCPDHPDAGAVPDGELSIRERLAILRRRRRIIFWTVVLLTTVATLIGLWITPTYTATVLVMIEPQENQIVNVEEVVQGLSADAAAIETQIRFIQSRENVGRTLERLNLYEDPEFFPQADADARANSVDGSLGSIGEWLPNGIIERLPNSWLIAAGLAKEPAIEVELDRKVLEQRSIDALLSNLKVVQAGRSYVLSISYTSTEPHRAAWIANGIARAYIDGRLDDKLTGTKRASSWLAERVDELRGRVQHLEEAVQEYRASKGLVDQGTLDAQHLAALTAELIAARAERTAKEARLRRIFELQSGNAGEALTEAVSSPLMMSLRQRELELLSEEAQLSREYGARHPRILQLQAEKERLADRIGQEIRNTIGNLENEIEVARSREQALDASLGEAKGQSALTGQAGVQLRELEREAAANRSLYEAFLIRLKETEEQQQIVQADVRVISSAQVPDAPSSPSPKLFAAVGFTASIVLGSVLAFLLEKLDNSLRSGRQVEQLLQVPALGLVPLVTKLKRGQQPHDFLLDKPRSAYAEGIRALYTQVRLAGTERPPKVVLVTSALPGEGKTSLAIGLAAFGAQLQQRTLLIDLDLRRPSVGQKFDVSLEETDIMKVVAGEASLEDTVHRDQRTGMDILSAAGGHSNPTALLTSQRLSAVLRDARERYDYVVIDTPPVLGVTDAKTLSSQVDAVVFVIQWGRTKRDAAQAALKELNDVAANIAGAILNQVDMKRHASLGYGDTGQYYSKYRKYYMN